ncbi:MAG: hypothetical protein HFJ94_09360 [Muribaculaceae bacterium]|nr:hypothetical protein [Muribaculaceae bacterium]
MKVGAFFSNLSASVKSVAKMALLSRRCGGWPAVPEGSKLIVMGNGPSLAAVIEEQMDTLTAYPTLAVNFAANAPVFQSLAPRYYVLADPLFFNGGHHDNVRQMWQNLAAVSWPMTLFVPAKYRGKVPPVSPSVDVCFYNFVGLEGFSRFRKRVYSARLGMPRPRNVLIPAIMIGIWLGFDEIYVAGADHSWTKTLEVEDDNTVVSVQPHFYRDSSSEHSRVRSLYKSIRLHELMYSFYVAFKSYFDVEDFARGRGVRIYNSTKGSFIDAFERRPLPSAQHDD